MMDRGKGVPKGLRETTRESLEESERLCKRWNGAEGGRLAYAFAPRFVLSCSERLLRDTASLAGELGAMVHSHAAEHADERRAVRAALGKDDVAALASYGIRGPRAVLAHGVQLTDAEMRRIARDGTRFVHCPSANLKLGSGIARVAAMRRAGIVVGLGADGAPCNNRMDPWTELRQAALLAKGRDADATALPAHEALELATIDGARVLGIDDRVGSIERGKRADLAVVDLEETHALPGGDAVSRLVYACTAADVRHVVIDGSIVVRDRELTTLDEEAVRADAKREASRVWKRAFG
jgi:5-methylthioadenosine/S-adenosylhomocysteine deaminase